MGEKKKKITENELEIVFWLCTRHAEEDYARDLPRSVYIYASIMLTNEIYLSYTSQKAYKDKDFVTFAYLLISKNQLRKKFSNVMKDLWKWKGERGQGKGGRTDLSPLRRRALLDYAAWQKWVKDKNYYLNWQKGIREKKLLFPEDYEKDEEEDMIKIVRQHFSDFMPTKKKKRQKDREEQPRQELLFPPHKTTFTTAPTTDDAGGAE